MGIAGGCSYDGTVRNYCPGDPTSNWSIAVFTTRTSQLILGNPNYNNNTVDNNNIQASSNLYFPADINYSYPLYKLVQNSRDLGVIAMGCAETAFCPGSAIRRAEASYYVTRGLLREFLALHAVTSNSGGVWEPAAASGVNSTSAIVFRNGGQPPVASSRVATYHAPNFISSNSLPSPHGNGYDAFIIYDSPRGKYVYVALDAHSGLNDVVFGKSTDSNGSQWSYTAIPLVATSSYYWDFPSVGVDWQGRIIVGAIQIDTLSGTASGFWTTFSTDAGLSFSTPVRVAYDTRNDIKGNRTRVVATHSNFHVFAPNILSGQQSPYKLWHYQSSDGSNWSKTLLGSFTQAAAYTDQLVCAPWTQPQKCNGHIFLAPLVEATGDQNSEQWAAAVPARYANRNNILAFSPTSMAFVNAGSGSDQFVGSTAIAPGGGSFWFSYITYSAYNGPNNVSSAVAYYPQNGTPFVSWAARGLTPASWLDAGGVCGETVTCSGAGDYVRMAVSTDNPNNAILPIIQQPMDGSSSGSPANNDLVSAALKWTGGFSLPPAFDAVKSDVADAQTESVVVRVGNDYHVPATAPARVLPAAFQANEARYPVGSDVRSVGVPAPTERLEPSMEEIARARQKERASLP